MGKKDIINSAEKNSGTKFRLEVFNFCIIIFTVIVTVLLSLVIYRAHATYDEFYDATEEYIACRTAAEEVHEASDYLTREVRAYAYEDNIRHLENYFEEANVTKRREKALDVIKRYVGDRGKDEYLENAVNYSMKLMEIEYYSMRLALEARGVPLSDYPDEAVAAVELSAEDAALSSEEKLIKARDFAQNTAYDDYKDKIYGNVSEYTRDLLNETRERERNNSVLFTRYQQVQMILIIILLCVLMVNVAFTSIFLIRPLRKNSKLMVEQDSMPVKGSHEMRTFAVLYNKVLEKTKTQQEKLSYDASHDSLTGIQNRSVFDEMYRTVHKTDSIALMLVDIDFFKGINDTHGHEVGDGVLKRVANVLHTSFRSDDIICRIGGDEFTVILNGVTPECQEQLQNKLEFIMKKLDVEVDNLPAIKVSIGVAFGDDQHSFKALYKQADEALYAVKSTTKNGIKFYGD